MGYVRAGSRGDRLGFFGLDDIAAAGAIASTAGKLAGGISSIFNPGKSRDEQRLQRANFFRDAALIGSVTAARYVIGGMQNTGGNEIPYYNAARDRIIAEYPDVWDAAALQGAKWAAGIPDPGGTKSMIDDVKRDLTELQQVAPPAPTFTGSGSSSSSSGGSSSSSSSTSSRPAQRLPVMTTTAPFNYTPWLIGGGALVAAAVLVRKS